jgi:hypothetical protein
MVKLVDTRVKVHTPTSTGVRDALVMRVAMRKTLESDAVDIRAEEAEEAEEAEAAERRLPALVAMVYWPVIPTDTNVLAASFV